MGVSSARSGYWIRWNYMSRARPRNKLKNRSLSQDCGVDGRGDRIRTCDHLVPNQVRYRTALRPDVTNPSGL